MALTEYGRKRNFKKTSEPGASRSPTRAGSRFVIQKHAASRLHYDFRLELDGVLKSWAVPKGMPFDKGEKRLAVQVEDHPVNYIDFEGTIPKGQYGGGTVMVWDRGTFTPQSGNPARELKSGKLHFTLTGKKLHGEWYLVQLRHSEQWLLIKGGEDLKRLSSKAEDQSALSGKTMAQLSRSEKIWQSKPAVNGNHRPPKVPALAPRKPGPSGKKITGVPLKFIEPMKALLTAAPPPGDWVYEIKFDGYRALALIHGRDVRLFSRNEKDFAGKFPEIVEALQGMDIPDAILDGEIVALNGKGISSFQLLQSFDLGEERPPIFFYAFDLLRVGGKDLRSLPLADRKARLQALLKGAPDKLRFSASLAGDVGKLLAQSRKLGLEGLIGKRADSLYEPGRRSGAWIKLKLLQEQEFAIGGYSEPEGSRRHFGALLIGYHDRQKLQFCGKVGTGFNTKLLAQLAGRFQEIASTKCPFANLPEKRSGRFGAGVTAVEMRRCHWLQPDLVAQIKFSEWTRDGKLRQPVFLGLREDKTAREVVREKASKISKVSKVS